MNLEEAMDLINKYHELEDDVNTFAKNYFFLSQNLIVAIKIDFVNYLNSFSLFSVVNFQSQILS